jgi:hypothetical protein
MMKIRSLCLSSLVMIVLLTACDADSVFGRHNDFAARHPMSNFGEQSQLTDRRDMLHQFITNKLTGRDGIYTNLQESDQMSEAATGHEVLNESAGLMMRYYALTGQKDKFDQQWQLAKRTFENKTGLSYRYSPKLAKKYTMNATVDDLRIFRALDEAATAFQSDAYRKESHSYGKLLYQHNVVDGSLRDFYDETYQTTNSFITLCYIDVASLELLPVSAKKRAQLETAMLQIAKDGYLSDSFPFYQTRYDYSTHSYQSDNINTVESLLTILNLAEIKQEKVETIRYLKEQVKAGTLVGQYSPEGKPLNTVRSTAIYAITAMIGSVIADQELYEDCILKMNEFQVRDPQIPLNGGFGDLTTQQAYSFDNLMALLAYVY